MEYSVPFWKEAPFLRLILPLTAGIWLQYQLQLPLAAYWLVLAFCIACLPVFVWLRSVVQFRNYWMTGVLINLLLLSMGGVVAFYGDIRNDSRWFGKSIPRQPVFVATILQPLSEGTNTFKTTASLDLVLEKGGRKRISGNVLLYFKKDTSCKKLDYASRIAFKKLPGEIKNSGNPGGFDFKTYCSFKNIFHQLYLAPEDYAVLGTQPMKDLKAWLLYARRGITNVLQTYIPGKAESGLAEALLIGYKEHLDKELIQSYSRTGVIHVIAISGLHVGLIYGLLSGIFALFPSRGSLRLFKPVIITAGLWLFGALSGAGPSVMRSVLMFSFLVFGKYFGRKSAVYNSLFASAFLLLAYDPFLLWDAGFQLSYTAVLSILLFTKPIYDWLYIKNKGLDMLWKSCALCIAAQWLTTPVSIYHFHQFPIYFLLTNLLAVPLSGVILTGEILLCCASFLPLIATKLGFSIHWLISFMNGFVGHMGSMPFAVADRLLISFLELVLLYLALGSTAWWLMRKKNARGALLALCAFATIGSLQMASKIGASHQQKIIVYNIPHHSAIDLVNGRHCRFTGDSGIVANRQLKDWHLTPTRNLLRLNTCETAIGKPGGAYNLLFQYKRILIVRQPLTIDTGCKPLKVDIVIISGDPEIKIPALFDAIDCKHYVFDASNSLQTIGRWKSACEAHGVSAHAVAEKGAFILDLN